MNLFAYGTLQAPEVLGALTGRRLWPEPAELPAFRRRRFQRALYPGVVAEPGARVRGALYRGLDATALAWLDLFEGDEYRRRRCRVRVGDGEVVALVYEVHPGHRHRLQGADWSLEEFRRRHLQQYVRRCRRIGGALRRGQTATRWV